MKQRPLSENGLEASVVAFGAWAIGGWKWGGTDANASIEAIRASLDAGVNFIDTAAIYGFGLSEELVGEAIKGRVRKDIVVATKCGLRWDIETPVLHNQNEGKPIYRTLGADSIAWEVEQSLARLKTDYIDLYLTHWPDPETPLEETISALESLKSDGRVREWGFCNSAPDSLELACETGSLCADQERYSLLDREQDQQNLKVCQERRLAFLAYSPIAQGLLTGKVDGKRKFAEGDLRRGNPRFAEPVLDAVQALLAPVKSLARQRGVTTEQLLLAWTLEQSGVTHVLVGARNAEQSVANARAGDIELADDEMEMLSQVAKAWPGFDHFTP